MFKIPKEKIKEVLEELFPPCYQNNGNGSGDTPVDDSGNGSGGDKVSLNFNSGGYQDTTIASLTTDENYLSAVG